MKKYLFLLIVPLILFFPKDTFAKDVSIKPTSITGNEMLSIGNNDFYIFKWSNATSGINYDYTFEHDYAYTNMNYSFLIYMGSYQTSQWIYKPIVQLNHSTCEVVQNNSLEQSNTTKSSNVYAVKCSNVRLDNTKVVVNIVQPETRADLNSIFGISKVWDFTPVYSNSDITSSIDKNTEEQEKTNEKLDEVDKTLKDDSTDDAKSEGSSFFEGFESDDFGLSDIVTMPLKFIQGLSSSVCYSLNLPLPFVNTNVTLPCMTSIYSKYFGSFLSIYQTITTGIISYWVCVNIFRMVKNFKNPDNDEIEVMDL